MTPQQLKASILKYAMQGKLVEQKPEDGTGEDLFCKIQQVSKPNKNVTPIVEEEIPFDIPSSWKWCKFGELVDCSMGKTPPRAEPVWWQNDIHWVSISDMKDYGHISYTKEMVSQKALEEKFGGISTKGTLLMSFKLTVGRTSILDIDAVHNEAIISIYPYVDTENYFRDYLFYFLPIVTQWGDSKNAIKGKTLNSKSIANLMIPLAPLNELQRIVAKIEELLPYVDCYAAAYEKLEQFNAKFPEDMKKSILQYAIQGKLVEQRPEEGTGKELYRQIQEEKKRLIKEGTIKKEKPLAEIAEDEIPFDIPENWKWVQLGNLASINGGFAFKSTNYRNVGDSPAINVYTLADIELQFSEDSAGNKKLLPASLLPGFTQALSAEEETDINIHFETSEVKALICELRKASEKNWERLRTNPSYHHYTGAKLIIRVFFKNLMGQWCESTISYEIAWLAYKNPAPQKTHNLNENTIPPKEIREGDEFKAVLSSHHIAPFVFAMTTDKHVIDVLQGYTDESPWLSAVLKDNYT